MEKINQPPPLPIKNVPHKIKPTNKHKIQIATQIQNQIKSLKSTKLALETR